MEKSAKAGQAICRYTYIDRSAQFGMVFSCIFALTVTLWIINVFNLVVQKVRGK
jgi:hypothetical protein